MTTETLGDVHLGKKFEAGVPLHRRGDRERMQFEQFTRSLMDTQADVHVQVGDLFDKFYVPFNVIWRTAETYKEAVVRNPGTTYIVLRGNHDASRDADKISAFQIFAALVRPYGVRVAADEPVRVGAEVFIPWHPFITAREMIEKHADMIRGADAVYGHWDIVNGQDNQLPSAELRSLGVGEAFTGHDHTARTETLHGLKVTITGSMQPYSHAEDATGELYVTLTLTEALARIDELKDKSVRLILGPDEQLDVPIDCLQLQVQRQKGDGADMGQVDFEEFDLKQLFQQAVNEVGLSGEFAGQALERLEAERAAQQA